jgi:hypothetical protein
VFDLTKEMIKLHKKLSFMRQSYADIIKPISILSSTRVVQTQEDEHDGKQKGGYQLQRNSINDKF